MAFGIKNTAFAKFIKKIYHCEIVRHRRKVTRAFLLDKLPALLSLKKITFIFQLIIEQFINQSL